MATIRKRGSKYQVQVRRVGEAIIRFFESGLTATEVAVISGHRDMRMLFRYSHSTTQRVIRQLDIAEARP